MRRRKPFASPLYCSFFDEIHEDCPLKVSKSSASFSDSLDWTGATKAVLTKVATQIKLTIHAGDCLDNMLITNRTKKSGRKQKKVSKEKE